MIYECVECGKLVDEKDGIMKLGKGDAMLGVIDMYVFKCKNCMSEKGRENFEKLKIKYDN